MKNENTKKYQLYINTDDFDSKQAADYIDAQKNKSEYIRNAVLEYERNKEYKENQKSIEKIIEDKIASQIQQVLPSAVFSVCGEFMGQILKAINNIEVKPVIIQSGVTVASAPVAAPATPNNQVVEEPVKEPKEENVLKVKDTEIGVDDMDDILGSLSAFDESTY